MVYCLKGLHKSKNKVKLKQPSSMLIICLLVVFRRLVSVECPGLNPDWLFESYSFRQGNSCWCTNFSKSLTTADKTDIGLWLSGFDFEPFPS